MFVVHSREHDGKELTEEFIFHTDAKLVDHGKKECTYSITIQTAQHEHTGTYTFTAKNKSGKAESQVSKFLNLLYLIYYTKIICSMADKESKYLFKK